MSAPTGRPDDAAFPAAPWRMVGSMWLSVFRLGHDVDALRPRGLYGAAFVSYTEPSPLTYAELVVARALRADERRDHGGGRGTVTVSDIWVDSPASVAGGRALWAIPKGLGDFDVDTRHRGPLTRTDWAASLERRPVARATFTDAARAAPRLPFRGATWQPALPEGGGERTAPVRGTARSLPARARWDLAPDGPLGFLREARQVASFRLTAFRMTFGQG